MTAVLFSRDWYRLAELKPQLHRHVEVHVHRYRQERSYVLQNHSTGQFRRLSPQAYLLVGLMDGNRTIETVWQLASERLGEELPTHEEVVQLIGDLSRSNILKMDHSGDAAESLRFGQEQKRKKWLGKLRSPLSVQIPLLDPNDFLDRTKAFAKPFFTKGFLLIWLLMVGMLAVSGWRHWSELTSNMSDQILAADNIFLLWLVYPVIKLFHELGHGYAIKRYGGQVHEVGIMLLVFFPMPYVDASASTAFTSKHQRMLVDAAGMLVELFIASLAMLVWINAEDGLAKSFAYNILFIAGVSTLLFNGNPLLRFDGYYLLADWLEMPNLSQNSNKYWAYISKRYLFGLRNQQSPANTGFKAFVFMLYGAASFMYRLFISITIALFVASKYFFIGVILAIWSIVMVWLWPLLKTLWQTFQDKEINTIGRSPIIILPLIFLVFYVALFEINMPKTTSVEGVVLAKEDSRLTVKENCFFDKWIKTAGSQLNEGDSVFTCHNKKLSVELEANNWRLKETNAKLRGSYSDPVQVKVLHEEIALLTNTIDQLEVRLENLTTKSQVKGQLFVIDDDDNYGDWLKRGDVLAYVIGPNRVKINAMLPEYLIDEVRSEVVSIRLMGSSDLLPIESIQEWRVFPSTSKNVISPLLAEQGGGRIKLDPSQENKAISSYFYVEVLPKSQFLSYVNQRVYLQFIHEDEPLGYRIYRQVRRTFLSYFEV
ncbi:MAG: putative peptide zinc metalloprotease protein [Glaciecola sp.]|jgi:putative peptide zinc metalloprotease protein